MERVRVSSNLCVYLYVDGINILVAPATKKCWGPSIQFGLGNENSSLAIF